MPAPATQPTDVLSGQRLPALQACDYGTQLDSGWAAALTVVTLDRRQGPPWKPATHCRQGIFSSIHRRQSARMRKGIVLCWMQEGGGVEEGVEPWVWEKAVHR